MTLLASKAIVMTVREQQLLRLVAEGLTNKEIAARTNLSEQTVKTHVSNMISKSGRRNRAGLVAFGFETGILRAS